MTEFMCGIEFQNLGVMEVVEMITESERAGTCQ